MEYQKTKNFYKKITFQDIEEQGETELCKIIKSSIDTRDEGFAKDILSFYGKHFDETMSLHQLISIIRISGLLHEYTMYLHYIEVNVVRVVCLERGLVLVKYPTFKNFKEDTL